MWAYKQAPGSSCATPSCLLHYLFNHTMYDLTVPNNRSTLDDVVLYFGIQLTVLNHEF